MVLSAFLKKFQTPNEQEQAVAAYERITSLTSDSREARSLRIRMGLLCRAHLDRTFIEGAEKTAQHEAQVMQALAQKAPRPDAPGASTFQMIPSSDRSVCVYLPQEYVDEAFSLGALYQRTAISAQQAIASMQSLADRICTVELKLEQPFEVLQFLREEQAPEDSSAPEPPP